MRSKILREHFRRKFMIYYCFYKYIFFSHIFYGLADVLLKQAYGFRETIYNNHSVQYSFCKINPSKFDNNLI